MRGNRRRQQNQEIDTNNLRRGFYNTNYNFNHDGFRVREFPHSRGIICRYCNAYHYSQSEKCYFFCLYCQSIHFKNSMNNQNQFDKNMICPMLKQQALRQQKKKAFICVTCEGNGFFQKIVQTTYLEPKTAFQNRVAQYQKLNKKGQTQLQPPHRKAFRNKLQSNQEICETCKGEGKIYKMTHCCQNGCPLCGFTKIKINPKWREIHLKGENNDEPFPCLICCEKVEVGQKILKVECGHSFHRGCILSWLHLKEGCYKCSQVDPYLERDEFPEEYLDHLQLIKSIMKQKTSYKGLENIPLDSKRKEIKRKDNLKLCNMIKQSLLPSEGNDTWLIEKSQLQQSFYSLSYVEKSESQRQIPEQQNADSDSFIIRQVNFQNQQRDLSLDLSEIINNHNAVQKTENLTAQNYINQTQFSKQVQKKKQQVTEQSSKLQENIVIQ